MPVLNRGIGYVDGCMTPFLRQASTKPGVTAVQIVSKVGGRHRIL